MCHVVSIVLKIFFNAVVSKVLPPLSHHLTSLSPCSRTRSACLGRGSRHPRSPDHGHSRYYVLTPLSFSFSWCIVIDRSNSVSKAADTPCKTN